MFGVSKSDFLSHEQRIQELEQSLEIVSQQNERIAVLMKEVQELRQKNDELKSQALPRLTKADIERIFAQQIESLSLRIIKS